MHIKVVGKHNSFRVFNFWRLKIHFFNHFLLMVCTKLFCLPCTCIFSNNLLHSTENTCNFRDDKEWKILVISGMTKNGKDAILNEHHKQLRSKNYRNFSAVEGCSHKRIQDMSCDCLKTSYGSKYFCEDTPLICKLLYLFSSGVRNGKLAISHKP